jgi:exopolyphosphatase/guanosine-5'-triphosphate,3'-diphosphate pyrophosphatase
MTTDIGTQASNLRAVIDIGSNSVLLLIVRIDINGFDVLESQSRVTALGRDLDKTNSFHPESMSQTYEALKEYAEIAKKYKIEPSKIIITATEASRVAKNALDFFESLKSQLGITVRIINAQAEAYFSAKGILADQNLIEFPLVVMDIGGASTELIKIQSKNESKFQSISIPVGSVRYKNWSSENSNQGFETIKKNASVIEKFKTRKIVCVAGTMTSIANMLLEKSDFVEEEVHGVSFKVEKIEELIDKVKFLDESELLSRYPFLGKRVSTIQHGMQLFSDFVNFLDLDEVYISTYGLRFGVALEGQIQKEFWAKTKE